VSDSSTDNTDQIVESYARQHEFICFMKLTRPAGRSFAAKVVALQKCKKLLEEAPFGFIGNIDADITVEPNYFEALINRFERHPQLGLAAGFIYEEQGGQFRCRASNRADSIPHAAQLVRRECYEVR
jgi:cellulose synthase/poly-beta-1,6-N-acetylglucosamine synthase-like glycosyltransferase